MKHLKLFESFSDGASWEIASDTTYLEKKKEKIDWDSSEISKVRNKKKTLSLSSFMARAYSYSISPRSCAVQRGATLSQS